MKLTKILGGLALTAAFSMPAFADIEIEDAYARAASPTAIAGAAFMEIHNTGDEGDRLIGVSSDIAHRVELHTNIDAGNGVMQMRPVEGGLAIPAGATHRLMRGGDHVMLMGLQREMVHGETVTLTLEFEGAGDITIEVPIDLERQDVMQHAH